MKNKKVVIAMSGGVDSSVAAALLKEQGYSVIGITMQVWPAKKSFGGCCSLEAIEDAKKVADKLQIPHYVLNFREIFKEKVIDDFVDEYKKGRTPNPCIRCNQFVKFEYLLNKTKELGADFIATGHYARIIKNENNKYSLLKGIDASKDQSYALYTMNQNVLSQTLFPVGDIKKEKVREIAHNLKLPVAQKAESQEICFIEDDDYGRFLKEVCPEAVKPGQIIDINGNVLGMHAGIAFYTIGQRKGIGAHKGRKYVIEIDQKNNRIIIGDKEDSLENELTAKDVTYVSGEMSSEELEIKAKIRYNTTEEEATLYSKKGNKAKVIFKYSQPAITPGQSVVFYKGDEVLGGGIISK